MERLSLSYRGLWLFSLPSILSYLLEPLALVVDTAFVGRLNTEWLAALAIGGMLVSSFTWGFNFLVHATIRGVAAASSNREALLERVRIACYSALGVGVLSGIFLWASRFFWYQLAGAEGDLLPLVDRYFEFRLLGHPFYILCITLISVLRGLGRVHVSFGLVALMTAVNIIATWYFLYVEKTDLIGAAYGTVISNVIGCLGCLILLLRGPRLKGLFGNLRVSRRRWFDFGKEGWDIFLRTFSLTAIFFIATRLAASLGVVELAAHQVLVQIYLLSAYFIDGIATSANILGANFFATGKMAELRAVFSKLLRTSATLGALFTLALFLAGGMILGWFTKDAAVISLCLSVLPLIALTQVISSLSFTYDGIMFGLGEFAYLRKHIIIAALFIFLPISLGTLHFQSLWCLWAGIIAVNFYRMGVLALKTRQICHQ